jgi:phage shock protein E
MEIAALALSLFAFVLALRASLSSGGASATDLEDAKTDARRRVENLGEELRHQLAIQQRFIAELAAGKPVDPRQVEEGRLWADALAPEALAMLEDGQPLHVLDVRTPQEHASGVIPGAQLIPVDQLEARLDEVPQAARTLVVCAGGGRSAAACEFMSSEGRSGLFNLAGGMGSWSGPVEKPKD